MIPQQPDFGVVERRLRALADASADLARLRHLSADDYRRDPIARAAAERLLQVEVDLAIDINAHLSTAVLGRAPSTGRESFAAAAAAGVLSQDLASLLMPAAGLRNVLVHRYVDIDVDLVAQAVGQILDVMPRYLEEVARYLRATGSS